MADYRLCDVCDGKVFYDSNLNYEPGPSPYRDTPPFRFAGKPQYDDAELCNKHGLRLDYLGDWAVICEGSPRRTKRRSCRSSRTAERSHEPDHATTQSACRGCRPPTGAGSRAQGVRRGAEEVLPARATPRAEMLQRGAETVRDRQRATLDNYLRGVLQAITPGDSLTRHYLTGAALAAQAMDVLTMAEASAWIERAWEASRATR